MFDAVLRLYRAGRIGEAGVREAVRRGWLTREQMAAILEGSRCDAG